MTLRFYGYRANADETSPSALSEVTFVASPDTLRRLSDFFRFVADEMDRHGESFGHEHFEDFERAMKLSVSLVVARDSKTSD